MTNRTPVATRVHASCVLVGRLAVLVRGAPGSGKSALVADLLERDGPSRAVRLVADDAVDVIAAGGRLVAFAPEAVRGLIEMRGVGLVAVPVERRALVGLVVDLVPDRTAERLPEADAAAVTIEGVALPRLALPAGVPGLASRVLAAINAVDAGRELPVMSD